MVRIKRGGRGESLRLAESLSKKENLRGPLRDSATSALNPLAFQNADSLHYSDLQKSFSNDFWPLGPDVSPRNTRITRKQNRYRDSFEGE